VDEPVVIGDAPAFRRLMFVASASPSSFGVAVFVGAGRRHRSKAAAVVCPAHRSLLALSVSTEYFDLWNR
jgi:hypothetical protein